ncbi:DUF6286 domain-containing protein [Arthrobacter sp.]|jgi:hypothetical protein|uniref:DUF6286 domain-containing protein n=1 Tax=Arthrobacter sp. TaxID=1667 RepID=UPI00258BCB76|nr:DUF6286 domain-containing protein [Arthrobacter sp.]
MSRLTERILTRESHSSRAPLSVVAAILITMLAVYGLLEAILRAVGQPPWLIDPLTAADRLSRLPDGISPVLLGAIGVLLFLLGLVFLGHAVLPGRRARHTIADPRVAIVVDDEVIASALARRARLAAGVTREQVMVVVSARTVQVNVRPTSGIRLSESHILAAVEAELADMALEPAPEVTVKLSGTGVIGV